MNRSHMALMQIKALLQSEDWEKRRTGLLEIQELPFEGAVNEEFDQVVLPLLVKQVRDSSIFTAHFLSVVERLTSFVVY